MKKTTLFSVLLACWMIVLVSFSKEPSAPAPKKTPNLPSIPVEPQIKDPELIGVQVPVTKECRVFNKSGSQCVWCSIECLGRHHKIKELYEDNRRLTLHYTWATGPGEVSRVLSGRYPEVHWKQIQNRASLKPFLRKYVAEKKLGVGLGIPGHMLNVVHFDEAAGIVKIIDNYGPKALQIQDWTMEKFDRLADGWAIVIFPPGYVETSFDAFDCSLSDPDDLHGI